MNTATGNVYSQGMSKIQNEYSPLNDKQSFLSGKELSEYISGCVLNDRLSQKRIYNSFYNYALTVCTRYANNYDDSVEIVNDGFLKVFKEIYRYKSSYADVALSFKGWVRKIMIHTAIDHFRKNKKHRVIKELDNDVNEVAVINEDALDKVSYEEILGAIQQITPGYRVILNLFVIEGFSHEEIAGQLGISIGSSKSNLARGRRQLQRILLQKDQTQISRKIVKTHSISKTTHSIEMEIHG